MKERTKLPNFQEAIRTHGNDLPDSTRWRYSRGMLPELILFIAQRPALARALVADADVLAQSRATKGGDAE